MRTLSLLRPATAIHLTALALIASVLALVAPASAAPDGPVRLISVNADGTAAGNDQSQSTQSISDDGRYIVFASRATDLVDGFVDNNTANLGDVFIRDTATGTTTLVSHAAGQPTATATGGSSGNPRISADGRYVVYDTFASGLVDGVTDANGERDVYLYDVATGTNTLVSHVHDDPTTTCTIPGGAVGGSLGARISDDGAYVAYQSVCEDLQDNLAGTGTVSNVYRYDRAALASEVVSRPNAVNPNSIETGDGNSVNPRISGQGNVVVYSTSAANIAPTDTNGTSDVGYWRAPVGNLNTLSTVLSTAGGDTGNGASGNATVSDDGVYVAFQTEATDIGPGNDTNNTTDVILAEVPVGQAPTYTDVSANTAGTDTGNGPSFKPYVSGDGSTVAFLTNATDIISAGPVKANGTVSDVVAHDRASGDNSLVSVATGAVGGGDGDSGQPGNATGLAVSDNGDDVLFTSEATNLSDLDDSTNQDIYVTTRSSATVALLSTNAAGDGESNGDSRNGSISSDGMHATFQSDGDDLTDVPDTNNDPDIFAALTVVEEGEFSIDNVMMDEGDEGETTFTFTVMIDQPPSSTVTVDYATADGSATGGTAPGEGIDYLTAAGTATFGPGETTKTVEVTVYGDLDPEDDETFTVALSNPSGGTTVSTTSGTGTGTILNDDQPPGTVAIDDVTMDEGNEGETTFTFNVTLGGASSETITVDYATVDDGATGGDAPGEGIDYLSAMGTVTFAPGETAKPIEVTVYGDLVVEADEHFDVELANVMGGGYTLAPGQSTGIGVIVDDDLTGPVLAVGGISMDEGDEGTTLFGFKVKLGDPATDPVTVDYATSDGTATGGDAATEGIDYRNASGTVTFEPGETLVIVNVSVYGDLLEEPDETFDLTLSNPSAGYTIAEGLGTGTHTILDDDGMDVEVADLRDGVSDTLPVIVEGGDPANPNSEIALRLSRATFPSADNGPEEPPAENGPEEPPAEDGSEEPPAEDGGTFAQGETAREALLATDGGFADALASGGLQGNTVVAGRPLLLTATDQLYASVLEELNRLGVETVRILGGTVAISQAVEDELVAQGFTVSRIQGPSRLETAQDAAGQLFPDATTAILVRAFPAPDGDDTQAFADSLAAGGWAAAAGWPLLFTQTEVLSTSTSAYLEASSIETLYVVGGEAAINESVLDQLRALGIEVIRVAGPSRFDTALAIAQQRGYTSEADADQVMVLDGTAPNAWAAGFAGAAYSAIHGAPVVLGAADQIPGPSRDFLSPPTPPAFAVDEGNVTGYVLVCGIAPDRCTESRSLLGLPDLATATEPTGEYAQGGTASFGLTGDFSASGHETLVDCSGEQELVTDLGPLSNTGESTVTVDVPIPADHPTGECLIKLKLIYPNGSEQLAVSDITVTTAAPEV